jgi:hypothetical protein
VIITGLVEADFPLHSITFYLQHISRKRTLSQQGCAPKRPG